MANRSFAMDDFALFLSLLGKDSWGSSWGCGKTFVGGTLSLGIIDKGCKKSSFTALEVFDKHWHDISSIDGVSI